MADLTLDHDSTEFMVILYIILGFVAVMCNCLNLSIYYSNRALLRKYLYFMALDFGEFVNGVSYILVGSGRGAGLWYGYINEPMTVFDCFYKRYWPHALILGTELPAYCALLISFERLCAVLKPAAYNRVFMGPYKPLLLGLVPCCGFISVGVGALSALGAERDRIVNNQFCPIISSTSIWYSTYHFSAIVVIYAFSFSCLCFIKYKTRGYAKVRAGDNRIGLMMAISGSSILLIGSSSYVMITTRWNLATYDNVTVSITYAMPGFLSILNTVFNLIFRKELRQQLYKILRLGDSHTITVRTVAHTRTDRSMGPSGPKST